MAFMQYRLTREPSLPVIGAALVCAGAMDGFRTFAETRRASRPSESARAERTSVDVDELVEIEHREAEVDERDR